MKVARLSLLDSLLTLSGNRLSSRCFGRRRWGDLLNYVMRFLITLATGEQLRLITLKVMSQRYLPPSLLSSLAFIVTGLFNTCLFAFRRQDIKSLISRLQVDSDSRQTSTTRRLFACACAVVLLELTIDFTTIAAGSSNTAAAIRSAAVAIVAESNMFFVYYPILYVVVLQLLTRREVQRLESMERGILQEQATPWKLMQEVQMLANARRDFDRLFNVVPFILLALPFLTLPTFVASFSGRSGGASTISQVYDFFGAVSFILPHTAIALSLLLLVRRSAAACDARDEQISRVVACIHERKLTRLYTEGWQPLVHQMQQLQRLQLTVGGMFPLEKSIILSFLSSLISISVLVIQLLAK